MKHRWRIKNKGPTDSTAQVDTRKYISNRSVDLSIIKCCNWTGFRVRCYWV